MKKFIIALFIMNSSLICQELSMEAKADLISKLDSSNATGTILSIIEYEINEALPKVEDEIWNQKSRFSQLCFLDAMLLFESPNTYNFALAFLDTINSNPDPWNEELYNPLSLKVDITAILFEFNDYSTTPYVFEYIEEQKPEAFGYNALTLLPRILENVPEFRDRAKEELIWIADNYDNNRYRMFAERELFNYYRADIIPYLENKFWEETSSENKYTLLTQLMEGYVGEDFLRNVIIKEPTESLKYYAIRILLDNFPSINNYNFVKNNRNSLFNEETYSNLSYYEIRDFRPSRSDSAHLTISMLDTLTSYANQCYEYEWITNQKLYDKLIKKIDKAKKEFEKGKEDKVKKEIVAFQNDVYKQNGKYITDDGFKFLYYYPDYIIEKFPAGENLIMDSLSPTITITKTKDFTLTVYGSNFSKKSNIYFDGKKQKTKFISGNELEAKIKDKDFKKEGIYSVHVSEKKVGLTEELEFKVYKELPERLIPVINCVEDLEGKESLAWFGYENYNDGTVLIEGKKENEIKGGKKPKGKDKKDEEVPPVIFLPGIHEKVFSVEFDDKKKLKWELLKEKAEVTEDTPPCE